MGHKGRDGRTWGTKIQGGCEYREVRHKRLYIRERGDGGWWRSGKKKKRTRRMRHTFCYRGPQHLHHRYPTTKVNRWLGALGVRVYMGLVMSLGRGGKYNKENAEQRDGREESGMWKKNTWMESYTTEERTTEGVGIIDEV
jgi:hypothetical protein